MKLYEILNKLHFDVCTLKLPTNFVAHSTFHILKLKLFLHDEHRPYQKQKVQLNVDAIKHRLVAKIKNIFFARHTCFWGKKYLVKYKGCHHKEVMWMKPTHLDHLLDIVVKFEQERGHKLVVKRTLKKIAPKIGLNVDDGALLQWGRAPTK